MTHPILFALVLAAHGLALGVATQITDSDQALGQAVADALHLARLTVKEAASLMATDESQLRKQLRGEPSHHVSLTRLCRLPMPFWLAFIPALTSLVMRRHLTELVGDAQSRRSA